MYTDTACYDVWRGRTETAISCYYKLWYNETLYRKIHVDIPEINHWSKYVLVLLIFLIHWYFSLITVLYLYKASNVSERKSLAWSIKQSKKLSPCQNTNLTPSLCWSLYFQTNLSNSAKQSCISHLNKHFASVCVTKTY